MLTHDCVWLIGSRIGKGCSGNLPQTAPLVHGSRLYIYVVAKFRFQMRTEPMPKRIAHLPSSSFSESAPDEAIPAFFSLTCKGINRRFSSIEGVRCRFGIGLSRCAVNQGLHHCSRLWPRMNVNGVARLMTAFRRSMATSSIWPQRCPRIKLGGKLIFGLAVMLGFFKGRSVRRPTINCMEQQAFTGLHLFHRS